MTQSPTDSAPLPQLLPLRDVCELLVRRFGHTEGIWDISVEMQIALGAVGPSPDQALPGAILGVSKVGIIRAQAHGPNTVDAARLSRP